ncbi:MAG TPA: hypothetical protein VGL17_11700 [Gemmatimonadaceae bacterium]
MPLKADTKESETAQALTYRSITARWFGMLAPLTAAWGQQQLAYYLVGPACRTGHVLLLHFPPILALAITGLAAFLCWSELNEIGESRTTDEPVQTGSEWFFGAVGLFLSALALVVILAQWIPTLFIPACQH